MRTLSRSSRRTPARFRPVLEQLEDRWLLNGGGLDPTFGTGGRVVTDLGGTDVLQAMALQADGKIVAVGWTTHNGPTGIDFAVVRYSANGSLDNSFGIGGKVYTDLGSNDSAGGVAIQSDGRIVVVGYTSTATGGNDFAVVRYNVNGSIDKTFGGGQAKGIVRIDFTSPGSVSSSNDAAHGVVIQPDGKIVVAGGGSSGFAMARLTISGALDTSFNGTGKVVTQFAGGASVAMALTIQQDGKIVLAGRAQADTSPVMALARYNATGSLDASFDGDGEVTLGSAGLTGGSSVAMQADGKIVVAGAASVIGGPQQAALVRLNVNGSLDSNFAVNGVLTTSLGGDGDAIFTSIAIQPSDGKIVVSGTSQDDSTGTLTTRVVTARINTDGTMDSSFGTNGVVTTTMGASTGSLGAAVLIQPDGKIVVGGSPYRSTTGHDFALERYLP
jgi:uncharacterized delta-60 repeat protein